MIWLFQRYKVIVVLRVKRKAGGPVVKGNAVIGHNYAAAKALKIALDIRNHVAFAVCSTQIYRTAAERIAGLWHNCLFANKCAAFCRIFIAKQFFNLRFHITRVGNVFSAVGVGKLHGFNFMVQVFGTIFAAVFKTF